MKNRELLCTANMYIVCLLCLKSLIKLISILFWWSLSWDCLPPFFFPGQKKIANSEACCGNTILQLVLWHCPFYLAIVMGCHPIFLCENTKRKESWYLCLLVHTHSDKTVQRKIIRCWKALSRSLKLIKTLLGSKDDGT